MMTDELAVVGLVRARAQLAHPGDELLSDRAVRAAVRAFAGGASVAEATHEGRRLIDGWPACPAVLFRDSSTRTPDPRRVAVAS